MKINSNNEKRIPYPSKKTKNGALLPKLGAFTPKKRPNIMKSAPQSTPNLQFSSFKPPNHGPPSTVHRPRSTVHHPHSFLKRKTNKKSFVPLRGLRGKNLQSSIFNLQPQSSPIRSSNEK
jgi:hypothetical protein